MRSVRSFRQAVRAKKNARDFPWRHTRDPYRILVSEVMLQQTQVGRVAEKYASFLRAFPTVRSLANAELADVLKEWSGLGYNRRARSLHDAAKLILANHKGRIPRTVVELDALPGIGPATAAAICAYAYGMPTVYVETNIRAAIIHWFFPGTRKVSDEDVARVAARVLDRKNPRRWYNALMDYGTHIKETQSNPARRSASYARQSKFDGSVRQMRGQILRLLAEKDGRLIRTFGRDGRVAPALAGLERDGLVRVQLGRAYIASRARQ